MQVLEKLADVKAIAQGGYPQVNKYPDKYFPAPPY